MCTSLIVKPLFVIGIGLSLALVAVALFTPGWAKYTDEEGDTVKVGLVTRNCGSNSSSVKSVSSACKDYFNVSTTISLCLTVMLKLLFHDF